MSTTEPATWPKPLDDDHAVALLRRMVEIPSPSTQESELGVFLGVVMTELGYRITRDAAGNVIGSIGPEHAPEVMLLGHLDTCEGDLPAVLRDGTMAGRGTVDAKGPLAAMIMAGARAGSNPRTPCRITVVGVVEEETPQSKGAVNIGRTRGAPAALVVGEPSGWAGIVVGYKGKLDLKVVAEVSATHPTAPIPKATDLVARAWQDFLELVGRETGHDRFGLPGTNLTRITGDEQRCEAEFSVRTPPDYDQAELLSAFRARTPELSVEVIGAVDAVSVDTANVVCRALRSSIREVGGKPSMKKKTATSDMNILAEQWQTPMATYGPGDSRLDHSADEHIAVQEYLAGVQVLTGAVRSICTEHGPRPGQDLGPEHGHLRAIHWSEPKEDQ
jgi:[amino group carrier protein]-lysine/ornithine hydrolase